MLNPMLDLFTKNSPICVMTKATLQYVLADSRMDRLFAETAERQYCRELAFSTCVHLMTAVTARIHPSLNAAYKKEVEKVGVSVVSVYDKLKGIEPAVSERLVRDTAADLGELMETWPLLDGPLGERDVRIIDGNHLAGTDHRIKELRRLGAAALPGQTLAIFDPHRRLIEDVIVCEDGHRNQRSLFGDVLTRVQPQQCWIADSLFCTLDLLFGIADRSAHFVIRQHGSLQGKSVGRRRKIGRVETGMVSEQTLRITGHDGRTLDLRRITLKRDTPPQGEDPEIHILTNLPKSVTAKRVARAYRDRWQIETAFQEVTCALRCEITTLGYPAAALFGFCVALMMYNVLSTVQAAIRSTLNSRRTLERNLSIYAMADEIAGVWRGMHIAIPDEVWSETFDGLTPKQFARQLQMMARQVDLKRFTTHKWTAKRPQPQKISGNRGNHVSTQKILNQRKTAT